MRNIPPITKNLLIINVIMFLATEVLNRTGIDLSNVLGLHFFMAKDFGIYQVFTDMFMHAGLTHLFFNMFALWMFGCVVEGVWGAKKFLFYYLLCGVGAGLMQEGAQFVNYAMQGYAAYDTIMVNGIIMPMPEYLNLWTTVGASGAIYAILLAFGMIFPEERIFIFPLPIPIKAKWFVMIYVAIELFSAIGSTGDGVAHVAHLGGMLFGFLLIKYWKSHPYGGAGDFGMARGRQFFDRMHSNWEQHRFHTTAGKASKQNNDVRTESDWDYNARKKAEQDEIDRILDKIRKSGYDSLTREEKQRLFDSSRK